MQRNSGKRIQAGADLAGHDQSRAERAHTPIAPGDDPGIGRAVTCHTSISVQARDG